MSALVAIWSMIAAACAMLGIFQMFLWFNHWRSPVHSLSALTAFSAAIVAIIEMALFTSPEVGQHEALLTWLNFAIAMVVVPLVWTVRSYLPVARTWLAVLISGLWVAGILVNFLLPGNLTFTEVESVTQGVTSWGETYFVPKGTANDWKWLADLTALLIPIYVIDALLRSRTPRSGRRGPIIAIGVILFALLAGVETIMVDTGMLNAPYMVSAAFLSMVFAFTWVIARDVIRATTLTRELSEARHEAELLMRSNLLGEVASAMAHELNQPLAAILSNAQAAQKFMDLPAPDMDEIRDILDDVVRDDKRARDIILNLRHMLEGDEEAQQDVNLEAAIREMLEFIRQEFKDHAVKVEIDSTGQIPLVRGGRVGVQQVILNLVLNAKHALLEASSPDPVIHIRLRASHDGAEVEVRDFGPGIANSVRHRIFQPFVSTRDDGLGMGLAISRRIVEAQGGSLTVDDVHEGGGALFRLWLPAANR